MRRAPPPATRPQKMIEPRIAKTQPSPQNKHIPTRPTILKKSLLTIEPSTSPQRTSTHCCAGQNRQEDEGRDETSKGSGTKVDPLAVSAVGPARGAMHDSTLGTRTRPLSCDPQRKPNPVASELSHLYSVPATERERSIDLGRKQKHKEKEAGRRSGLGCDGARVMPPQRALSLCLSFSVALRKSWPDQQGK